jgi:hypothetical protein
LPLKRDRIVGLRQERLGYQDRMFGIVAEETTTEEQPLSPRPRQEATAALRRKPFGGQPQRIAHGRSEQDSGETIFRRTCSAIVIHDKPFDSR